MEKKIIDFFENIFLKKLSGKEQIQRTIKDKSNESFEIALKKKVKEIGKKQILEIISIPS